MITIGTKVRITDITDYFLQEGLVVKINEDKATIKLPGKAREFTYDLNNLEEIPAPSRDESKR